MTDTLRNEVTIGWKVEITDHDFIGDSRSDVTVTAVHENGLTLTSKKGWSSQEQKFSSMTFRWDGDKDVSGHTVRLWYTPAPHTGKPRRLIKTFTFTPPSSY